MIELINHWGNIWAEYFGFAVLQNTIFLSLVFLALFLLKNSTASIKYTITMIGLVKLFLPTFLSMPGLRIFSSNQPNTDDLIPIEPFVQTMQTIMEQQVFLNLNAILFLIWLFGAATFIIISIIFTIRLKTKLKNSEIVKMENYGEELPKIYRNHNINMPLTFGLFPDKIFVPSLWDKWSVDCRKMILNHELAHIKRRDTIVQILQILVRAVYFFHPLVWLLNTLMNEYREMACDDASITYKKSSPVEYSRYLLEIAENIVKTKLNCTPATSALIRQKNKLLNRVLYQFKEETMKNISKKRIWLVLSWLLLMVFPLSLTLSKQQQPQKNYIASSDTNSNEAGSNFLSHLLSLPEGGTEAIQKNFRYPEAAGKAGLEGEVCVRVEYDKNGIKTVNIKESTFEEGADLGCLQAVIDAVKSVKWNRIKGAEAAGGYYEFSMIIKPITEGSSCTLLFEPEDEATKKIQGENPYESGKIYGIVKDKKTGNPLPGANIIVEGTKLGAATNIKGEFFIINVPAGTYNLKTTMMGFESVKIASVNVQKNKSTRLDFVLKQAVIEAPAIVVKADSVLKKDLKDHDKILPPPPPPSSAQEDALIFVPYDNPPEPVGGFEAIQENLKIPEDAKKAGFNGEVLIHILVNEKGKIEKTKVLTSSNFKSCEEAAIKAIKSVKWNPAMQRDKPVKVWVAIPVAFKL